MDKMNENMNGPIFSHEPPRLSTATSIQDDRGDDNEDDDDEHTDGNDEHEHENEYYDDEDTNGTDDNDDDLFFQHLRWFAVGSADAARLQHMHVRTCEPSTTVGSPTVCGRKA